MINYVTLSNNTILNTFVQFIISILDDDYSITCYASILIPEKFNKRFIKLNLNRIKNCKNIFNLCLNYIIKLQ